MIEDGDTAVTGNWRYVEAYPRIEAAVAERMLHKGFARCHWHDQHDQWRGTVFVDLISLNQCSIRYMMDLARSSDMAEGQQDFVLVRAATNALYHKPYFVCPACGESFGQMIFANGRWACRKCHGLAFRSQFLSAGDRAWLRLQELARELRVRGHLAGRPRYMRHATYQRLSAEYAALRKRVKAERLTGPHAGIGLVLQEAWERADSDPR